MDFLNTIINNPIFIALSTTLLHFIWQGCILAIFLAASLKLISNKYSNLRYNLSIFTLSLCLITPCITYLLIYKPHSISQLSFLDNGSFMPSIGLSFTSYMPLLSIIWLIGVTYLSVGYCKELFSIYKLPKTKVSEPEKWLSDLFITIKEELNVRQNVRLLVSKFVDVPMVIGCLKPVVLVPLNMILGLTNEQLRLLIAHELAHVKRYDYFINLIQSLVEVFLFYHPAVKWISKQIRTDREYCCDDIAVKNQKVNIDYAKALLNAEELRPHTIPSMAMAATGGDLKSRVSRVVGEHTCTPKYAKSGLAGLFGLFVVCLIFSSYKVVGMVQTKEANSLVKLENINLMKPYLTQKEIVSVVPESQKIKTIEKSQPLEFNFTENTINKTIVSKRVIKPKPLKNNVVVINTVQANNIVKLAKLPEEKNTHIVDVLSVESKNKTNHLSNINAIKKIVVDDIEQHLVKKIDKKTSVEIIKNQNITEYAPLVIAPTALKMVKPIYTEVAQRRGYQGDVVIEFTVDLNGKAKDIEFFGTTKSHLKRAVRKAIKKWEFSPGTVNGNVAAMRETKLFSFVKPNREKMAITTGSLIAKRKYNVY